MVRSAHVDLFSVVNGVSYLSTKLARQNRGWFTPARSSGESRTLSSDWMAVLESASDGKKKRTDAAVTMNDVRLAAAQFSIS